MEVIITLLLCAVGFFAYIAYNKSIEVIRLREQLRYQEKFSAVKSVSQSKSEKIFVKVIFEKDAAKSYDYLLGDFEVKVGDFVVVRTGHINSGQATLRSAQVVYISEPGETSEYAKSKIFKKATHNKW